MTAATDTDPAVEVIIPHRSRWDLLRPCLDSLRGQSLVPAVCVVDNASEDGTLHELHARPDVRVCRMPANVGFGRAVNHGVRTSRARYVVILNNDMLVEPDCVQRLVEALRAGEDRRVTAALQLRTDGRVDTRGVAVDPALSAYDVGRGEWPGAERDDPLVPLGPSGGAAAFPRSLFEAVGGYDEAIFAYLEDVDLAIRLHAAGIPFVPEDRARVVHAHSSTLGAGSRRKHQLVGWSRGYLLWKYRGAMRARDRARALATDACVYAYQLAAHRNVGALEGRLRFRRERRRHPATAPVTALPACDLSLRAGLARRRGARA